MWSPAQPGTSVVAVDDAEILGTAIIGPNRPGRGSHVATWPRRWTTARPVRVAVGGQCRVSRHAVQRRRRHQHRGHCPMGVARIRDGRHRPGGIRLTPPRSRRSASDVPPTSLASVEVEGGCHETQLAVGSDDRNVGGMVQCAKSGGTPRSRLLDGLALDRGSVAATSVRPKNSCHLYEGPVTLRRETQRAKAHDGVLVEQQYLPVRPIARAVEPALNILLIGEEFASLRDVSRACLVECVDPLSICRMPLAWRSAIAGRPTIESG
jgi:hypothetical protein